MSVKEIIVHSADLEKHGSFVLDLLRPISDTLSAIPLESEKIEPEKVIFNNPATIVIWGDGTKSVVKCQDGDTYDPEKGLALAIAKKALGNKGSWYNTFKKWIPKEETQPEPQESPKTNGLKYKVGDLVLIKKQYQEEWSFHFIREGVVRISEVDPEDKDYLYYCAGGYWISEQYIEKKVED